MLILDFFKKNLAVPQKWVGFSEEIAGYEREVLRKLAAKQKRELRVFEIKGEGPDAELEEQFSALDFFSLAKIFYVHSKGSPAKWTDEAKAIWKKLVEQSDPQGNWLFVSGEHPELIAKAPLVIDNGSRCLNYVAWIAYFNETLEAKLSADRLQFLAEQNTGDVLELKHWVELWALGGDDWAQHALGWGSGRRDLSVFASAQNSNLSYQWVDAALAGNKNSFLRLTESLVNHEGEDPIRLMALLGKSIKIMAQLSVNEDPAGEPPFLITKMKRLKYRPELLHWWCHCDLAMKSTRSDVLGLLSQMP